MLRLEDESRSHRLLQVDMDVLVRIMVNRRQQVKVRAIAHTGQLLQCFSGFQRQTVQLPDHEAHHVIGVTLGVNAIKIPRPSPIRVVEGKQSLFGQR